jgi:hypothetical protein
MVVVVVVVVVVAAVVVVVEEEVVVGWLQPKKRRNAGKASDPRCIQHEATFHTSKPCDLWSQARVTRQRVKREEVAHAVSLSSHSAAVAQLTLTLTHIHPALLSNPWSILIAE